MDRSDAVIAVECAIGWIKAKGDCEMSPETIIADLQEVIELISDD